MLFRNPWLLAGLAGVLIPVILHLIRRQAAKPYDWGAMRFLLDTVVARRRRMEWEDFLLMIVRCLLIALLVLAVARPFVPPDTAVPWLFVLPPGLLGLAAFGGSFVLSARRPQWLMRGLALLMILAAGFLVWQEKNLNLKRFQTSERRDVALVIDGSTSMQIRVGGRTAFERAVEEAREFVKEAPKGTAFSIVLGGPAPELKTGTPLTHRADVLEVLDGLAPVGGVFRAHDALGMATLSLAEGRGSSKDLVVFSDQQRLGWQLESTTSWGNLGDAWEGLPEGAKPRLLIRSFKPPEKVRNVSVMGIDLSRGVVGTDREVAIRVRVENTGTEVVTPGLMEVRVGDTGLEPKGLGQMGPGESVIVDYRHQFMAAGPQVIRARLEGNDDLASDNEAEAAVWVRDRLPVVIVEGNAGGSFFERAGGYLALALAPVSGGGERAFVDPRVIDAAALTREDLSEEAVVILADVRRLPQAVAMQLAEFVMNGGGLWVVAGPKVDPEFYSAWRGGDGAVLPVALGEMVFPENGVRVPAGGFDHPTLALFKEAPGEDLGQAVVEGYRRSAGLREGASAGARFSDGEVFLAMRNYGNGRVLVSNTALDARLGNLPARPAFVPLVHELTNWLAGGQTVDLNVRASWQPTLDLPAGGGLQARYLSSRRGTKELRRIDRGINFNWERKSPHPDILKDSFEVTWEGSLLPPLSGEYQFESIVDDFFTLTLDDTVIFPEGAGSMTSETITLTAGQPVMLQARFEEESGEAFVRLKWKRPDGVVEPVPSSALSPLAREESRVVLGKAGARDPLGQEREVEALLGRRGKLLEVSGTAVPGEYRVEVPAEVRGSLEDRAELPLVVTRDGEESRLTGWNEDDRQLVRREIDLIELDSVQTVLAALRGEGFGREIWKILALAGLVLFFLEGLLARWVSKARRAGEEVKVDFEKRDEVPESFLRSVAEMKGGRP